MYRGTNIPLQIVKSFIQYPRCEDQGPGTHQILEDCERFLQCELQDDGSYIQRNLRCPDNLVYTTKIGHSHLPTTTAWILKMSLANKHLWPLSMVQIKSFLGVSTFLVGKFWGYSHIKLTNFKTCLWTCNMCHMGSEHTRL